jgi:hypothetical protein
MGFLWVNKEHMDFLLVHISQHIFLSSYIISSNNLFGSLLNVLLFFVVVGNPMWLL